MKRIVFVVLVLIPFLASADEPMSEVEARRKVLRDLTTAARKLDKPCPLAVVEAMLDKEDFVRWEAASCAQLFKTFETGFTEVLLRGADAEIPDVRGNCLFLLARVAPKDKKALAAMEKAKQDKTLENRHNAHVALFLATDKLDDFVAYLIRIREDPDSLLSPVKEDSELGKQERAQRNLIAIGGAIKMIEFCNKRPEELATILLKLLDDPSPTMRRGALNTIGAAVVKVELPEPPQPTTSTLSQLLPYLAPETPKPSPKAENLPEKSKVAVYLEKQKGEERLRHLRDQDKDRTVRSAAYMALERWASVAEKKP